MPSMVPTSGARPAFAKFSHFAVGLLFFFLLAILRGLFRRRTQDLSVELEGTTSHPPGVVKLPKQK